MGTEPAIPCSSEDTGQSRQASPSFKKPRLKLLSYNKLQNKKPRLPHGLELLLFGIQRNKFVLS
jgi:hypothetical protein